MTDLASASRDAVRAEIGALLAREEDTTQRDMLRYLFSGTPGQPTWGSLGRGSLLFLLTRGTAGSLPFAASIELLHHASLIVDDLIDHAIERRTLASFWTFFGEETATLFAHKVVAMALCVAASTRVPASTRNAAQERILAAIAAMADAELESQRQKPSTLALYLHNVRRRTGELFRLVGSLAHLLEGNIIAKPAETCEALMNIGAARQMADDFVDARDTASCTRVFASIAAARANKQQSIYALLESGYSIETLLTEHRRIVSAALEQLDEALIDSDAKLCVMEFCRHVCFRDMEEVGAPSSG